MNEKKAVYKLKSPVGNIEALYFYPPKRKSLKSVLKIREAVNREIFSFAKNRPEFSQKEDSNQDITKVNDQEKEELVNSFVTIVMAGETDTHDLVECFINACSNDSGLCKTSSGTLQTGIWDDMEVDDIMGAFKCFLSEYVMESSIMGSQK